MSTLAAALAGYGIGVAMLLFFATLAFGLRRPWIYPAGCVTMVLAAAGYVVLTV